MDRNRSMQITLRSSLLHGFMPFEGDDDKPEGDVEIPKELQTQVQKLIDKATEGLKSTNKALKDEKKAALDAQKAMLDQFASLGGAEGVKKLLDQHAKLRETEEGKLLTDGKHQEWLDLKTTALRKDHENQMKALADQLAGKDTTVSTLTSKLHRKTLSVEVSSARAAAKTLDYPGVQEDILNAAEKVFTYDVDRDAMVIKDEDEGVVFGKDGKTPKSVTEWLLEQQESRRHWWGESVGGGARGSERGGPTGDNPWTADNWNMTKQGEVIKTRGREVADRMAKAAGSPVGAPGPRVKSKS